MRVRAFAWSLVLFGILVPTAASADGPPAEPAPRLLPGQQWVVTAMPYAWLPYLQGPLTVKGRTVDLFASPIQVLDHLERAPWMSYIEARKGPIALYNDIFYANLGISASRARSFGSATINAALGVEFQESVIELGGAYEIARWSSGGGGSLKDGYIPRRYTAIDLLAGARYWHQDMAINLALSGTRDTTRLLVSGGRAAARSGGVDWVDPLVGLRVRHQLAPGQEIVLRGDIGGFDVGSRFSWNVLGAYSWTFAVRDGVTYSGLLGYRALGVDYTQGSGVDRYEYDVIQHGPVMGLAMRF